MHHPSDDTAGPPQAYVRSAPPSPSRFVLDADHRTTVAVVGAGFTGLSAALHLAEAGVSVTVLESRHIAWGASGRAFGQVVPYLKHDHAEVMRHYGAERGARMVDAIGAGPALVAGLVDRFRIACGLCRSGLIFGAHAPSGTRALEARAAYWQTRGAPMEMLDTAATRAATGSGAYATALLDHRGVHLNPFAYARGLANAAVAAGARIAEDAKVQSLTRIGDAWRLQVGPHTVTADAVILATNAYTDQLWPGLAASVIPVRGHAMVSGPLGDNLRGTILPGGQALTDTRRLFSGVRVLPDGRLHVSLDGPAFGPAAPPRVAKLNARLARLYPQLGRMVWEEAWSGFVAMTPDHFPRVHVLAPGLYAGLGYSGRGIAAATLIGSELAARIRGVADDALVFPVSPLRPLRWHRFAALPVGALLQMYRVQDAIDGFSRPG
ncbi:MAG: FAD-dependent oxidoreductase [Acetobacteraceae bacterium]|nr:FAD-dependent oxidoreductase [Acetobacteraceae bacterium]